MRNFNSRDTAPEFDETYFPPAPANRLRYCFETTPEGYIPLTQDWSHLLNTVATLSYVYVQVDHSYGRMSMRLEREYLLDSLKGSSKSNGLLIEGNYLGWSSAFARLEECPCCGSPGIICIFNNSGKPFLQINPPSDLKLHEWARLLSRLAITRESAESMSEIEAPEALMPYCPKQVTDLHVKGYDCLHLFGTIAMAELPLEFTIRAPEGALRQSYTIRNLKENGKVMLCSGELAGFRFPWPKIKRVVTFEENERVALLLIGPENRVLFEVRAQPDVAIESGWRTVLQSI
ncbi:MAG: hypothetical protein AAGH40_05780 [Verrucomicrobiota bacterium]